MMLLILSVIACFAQVQSYDWVKKCDEVKVNPDRLYDNKLLKTYCKMIQLHGNGHTLGLDEKDLCLIMKLTKERNIKCYFGEKLSNVIGNDDGEEVEVRPGWVMKIIYLCSILASLYFVCPCVSKLIDGLVTVYANWNVKQEETVESEC